MNKNSERRACKHTEHVIRSDGLYGRYFPEGTLGGAGVWEKCDAEEG